MSAGAAAVAGALHSGHSSVTAAEDAVRALWSSLNRLDHSLTYLLPENCEDAMSGEFCDACSPASFLIFGLWQEWMTCGGI